MFENVSSFSAPAHRDSAADVMIGGVRGDLGGARSKGGDALRALDWNELTARLNAARELRLLLRRDSVKSIGSGSASFGDAAARYFRDQSDDERDVNPDTLEPRKASRAIVPELQRDPATGDARDDG